MEYSRFLVYLLVMAGVTYLVRLLPMVLIRKKINNKFILSFLHYVPYAVLSAMTVPAIFYATSSPVTAIIGFAVALILSFFEKSLVTVAAASCASVLIANFVMNMI